MKKIFSPYSFDKKFPSFGIKIEWNFRIDECESQEEVAKKRWKWNMKGSEEGGTGRLRDLA